MVYTSVMLAILVSLLATTRLNLFVTAFFARIVDRIKAIKIKLPRTKAALHRENARRNIKGRTNEPEEAILIGIND